MQTHLLVQQILSQKISKLKQLSRKYVNQMLDLNTINAEQWVDY